MCDFDSLVAENERVRAVMILGSTAPEVFEPRTTTGSGMFSYLTCLHTATFILLTIFSLAETVSLKI